ncbi:MAG: hypothetical protein ACHQ6V_01535 [Myxococcota bacterium]
MGERRLVVLARFGDVVSADALVGLLAVREIAAHVDGADPLTLALGGRVRVIVAEKDLRRAHWVLDNADVSDGEAWLLATGELDPAAAKQAFATRLAPGERQPMRIALRVGAIGLTLIGALALLAR